MGFAKLVLVVVIAAVILAGLVLRLRRATAERMRRTEADRERLERRPAGGS